MKKYVNGKYVVLTTEEIASMEAEAREHAHREMTRPRTLNEGMLELNRAILADKLADNEDKTLAIACMAFFETWKPAKYSVGDIRTNPETGYPRECMIAHDSTVNPDWTITTPSLWKIYHSRRKEFALPWEQPTGAHDIYKAGEYMIWHGSIYRCLSDTAFDPGGQAAAWKEETP
jgi:hypothetical protein